MQLPYQGVIRPRHANKLITKQGLHTQFRRRIRANHPGFQVYRPAAQSLACRGRFLHKKQRHRWRLRRDMRQQGRAKVIHKPSLTRRVNAPARHIQAVAGCNNRCAASSTGPTCSRNSTARGGRQARPARTKLVAGHPRNALRSGSSPTDSNLNAALPPPHCPH